MKSSNARTQKVPCQTVCDCFCGCTMNTYIYAIHTVRLCWSLVTQKFDDADGLLTRCRTIDACICAMFLLWTISLTQLAVVLLFSVFPLVFLACATPHTPRSRAGQYSAALYWLRSSRTTRASWPSGQRSPCLPARTR